MKAYLFFEWPYAGMGHGKPKPCTEFEISDGTLHLKVWANNGSRFEDKVAVVPIPRPKKVKKWWWDFEDDNASDGFSTSGPYTEEEIKDDYPKAKWYHRIDETMVEVEE